MDHKTMALDFLNMVVAGKIDEAYQKYVDSTGQHHNVYFPSDFASLCEGMKQGHVMFPNKKFNYKFAIAEGDRVAVYSNVILNAEKNMAVVHMFRFKNGKIVEMWDCGQPIPSDSPNKLGAF